MTGMTGQRRFLLVALLPTFFFLACFYVYPTVFNLETSATDLSLFGLRKGGDWVGLDNYVELLASGDFRRVLWNTVVWLTLIGVTVRIVLGLALAFLLNSPRAEALAAADLRQDPADRALGDAAGGRDRGVALDPGSARRH
jgi:multiple sugar transport system permease protein